MIKLSIIIPYYNTLPYIKKLLNVIIPQLTNEIEVLIIDDGCNEMELDEFPVLVIHLGENSGGASIPRNVGLDIAQGEYITFIDSDDMVRNDYVQKILTMINIQDFDRCYISWNNGHKDVIINNEPPKWNTCVWNCVYKKSFIGDIRFNPELKKAEDWEFNRKVGKGHCISITEPLYFYNENIQNSLSKQKEKFNSRFKKV